MIRAQLWHYIATHPGVDSYAVAACVGKPRAAAVRACCQLRRDGYLTSTRGLRGKPALWYAIGNCPQDVRKGLKGPRGPRSATALPPVVACDLGIALGYPR